LKTERKVIFYQTYFLDFYALQTDRVQEKIDWTLGLIQDLPRIPQKYFAHIEGSKGLYEIRVEMDGNIFRIFCSFDKDRLIVLGNAFQKKSRKTPVIQINKAIQIMEEYFNEK